MATTTAVTFSMFTNPKFPSGWIIPGASRVPSMVTGDYCATVAPRKFLKTMRLADALCRDVANATITPVVILGGKSTKKWATPVGLKVIHLDEMVQSGTSEIELLTTAEPIWVYLDEYASLSDEEWAFVVEKLLPKTQKLRAVTSQGPKPREWPDHVYVTHEH